MRKKVVYGDIHANFGILKHLKRKHSDLDEIIIAGDFGVGFTGVQNQTLKYLESHESDPKIRFIRGNHDSPEACTKLTGSNVQWIPDGTLENGILYVGGAYSIDFDVRTPGFNWWPNEELYDHEWDDIFESIDGKLNDIHTVISHDGPQSIVRNILPPHKEVVLSRTTLNLEKLRLRLPNVKLWVFGHYHVSYSTYVSGTQFVCLPDNGRTHIILEEFNERGSYEEQN